VNHSETDIVTGCFVAARRISDESRELYNGKVPGVGILNHGSDDTATSECAAGGTLREDIGGVPDGISTNRTEAVATVESQREPPIDSMRATMTITSAKARMARGPWYLLGIFMV
jgi:hypothetical protein